MHGISQLEEKKDFYEWKNNLSNKFEKKIGIRPEDLPDYDYWNAFNNNMSINLVENEVLNKLTEDEIFHYWCKYIYEKYYEKTNRKFNLEDKLKELYTKKLSCYNVINLLLDD